MSEDKPWEPAPIPAEEFHQPGQQANINRAPYDVISGVIYKRGNIPNGITQTINERLYTRVESPLDTLGVERKIGGG